MIQYKAQTVTNFQFNPNCNGRKSRSNSNRNGSQNQKRSIAGGHIAPIHGSGHQGSSKQRNKLKIIGIKSP